MGDWAVFLDRDGVINANVCYADSGEIEAPRRAEDFQLLPGVTDAMRQLQDAGYLLFVVSNQPNQAKRKATSADHDAIQAKLASALAKSGIEVRGFYYCFHHPHGVEPSLSGPCDCRKPSPYFLLKAQHKYDIDMARSWMVGDRDSDIACGQAARVRTVRIGSSDGTPAGDYGAVNLPAAAAIILSH